MDFLKGGFAAAADRPVDRDLTAHDRTGTHCETEMRKRTENILRTDAMLGPVRSPLTRAPPSRELRNACTHHGGRFVCMHVWCAHSATSLPNQALSLPVSRSASRCVCHQHRASHATHAVLLLLVDENTRAGCRAREASANHSPPNNHGAAGSACSGCQLATARTSTALAPSLPHLKLRAPPHHGQAN